MKPGSSNWAAPGSPWELSPEMIHVWRVWLRQSSGSEQRLEEYLSDDERARAGRFHFERDRQRFSAARGTLRCILGGYLQVEPQSIMFSYGTHGKPALAGGTASLRFNLAHSGDLALVAVSQGRDVGVDLEFVRELAQAAQIIEQFFSPGEARALAAIPEPLRQRAFFACWTRKEAYIKARGGGLSIPLDGFEVSVAPGAPAGLLAVRGDSTEASRWSMVELAPAYGCMAALVAQGTGWRCCCHQWPLNTASASPRGVLCEPWRQTQADLGARAFPPSR